MVLDKGCHLVRSHRTKLEAVARAFQRGVRQESLTDNRATHWTDLHTPSRPWALAWLLIMALSVIPVTSACAGSPPGRPNVVVILADDLGWADVGWHGHEIRTPRLDSLAAAGAKLEPFYVQPVCFADAGCTPDGKVSHAIRPSSRRGAAVGPIRAASRGADWYPTLLKLAGANLEQPLPLDGLDARPAITRGDPSPHREILLNASPGGGAIRVGEWKLVLSGLPSEGEPSDERAQLAVRSGKAAPRVEELFRIGADPFEKQNLAVANPEKVKELRDRYHALADQAAKPKSAPQALGFRSPRVWGEQD